MDSVLLFIILQALWQFEVGGTEPQFDGQPLNITAIKGHVAVLPCAVIELGKHQIIWMNPTSTLISMADRRVIDDTRLSIERPYMQDWNLHIRHVQKADEGEYTCQINTNPIRVKRVRLRVLVPAVIDNVTSSGDITVKEGTQVQLTCIADGNPPPVINWFKKTPNTHHTREHIGTMGETLLIHNISRYCGGLYECEASNDIPGVEPDTRAMNVEVKFPPEVTFKNRRLGQRPGRETLLECIVTASPHALNMWKKDGRRVPETDSWKYRTEIFKDGNFTVSLYLRIINVEAKDFGEYTCEATNDLGSDSESILLYEYKDPTTPIPETTTFWVRQTNQRPQDRYGYKNIGGEMSGRNRGLYEKLPPGYAGLGDAYSSGSDDTFSNYIVLFLATAVTHIAKNLRCNS